MTMDGNTKTQDALPAGGQPSGEGANPSKDTPKYTEDEVNKRHAKLDKAISELTRERDSIRQSHESLKAEIDRLKKEREESELEKVKDDPDALSAYQMRKKQKEAEAAVKAEREQFEKEKKEHEAELAEARTIKRSKLMNEIAGEFEGGDPAVLEKTCDELGVTDPEKIRTVAATKWAKVVGGGTPAGHTDSGKNRGGAESLEGKSARELARMAYTKK